MSLAATAVAASSIGAKRHKTFAQAAAGSSKVQAFRYAPRDAALERAKRMLLPKDTRPLRFSIRADQAFSGGDFASLSIDTVRAAFTAALQRVAADLSFEASGSIKGYHVLRHMCRAGTSCFYLLEAECTPAFAEAAIAYLHPVGGLLPMPMLGRKSTAYAMRYDGEAYDAAPFVLAFTSAGDLSMVHEEAPSFCMELLEGASIDSAWAISVDVAGVVRAQQGLASVVEAARFAATRPRQPVPTCCVLVPGTRKAHDLVGTLYRSGNLMEVDLGPGGTQLLRVVRLMARLPAAATTTPSAQPEAAPPGGTAASEQSGGQPGGEQLGADRRASLGGGGHAEGTEGTSQMEGAEGNGQLEGAEGTSQMEGADGNGQLEGVEGNGQLGDAEGNGQLKGVDSDDELEDAEGARLDAAAAVNRGSRRRRRSDSNSRSRSRSRPGSRSRSRSPPPAAAEPAAGSSSA